MIDLLDDPTLAALVDEHEQLLRQRHPRLAEFLDLLLVPIPQFNGGWLVLDFETDDRVGVIYPTEGEAIEACRALVMTKLMAVDRVCHYD